MPVIALPDGTHVDLGDNPDPGTIQAFNARVGQLWPNLVPQTSTTTVNTSGASPMEQPEPPSWTEAAGQSLADVGGRTARALGRIAVPPTDPNTGGPAFRPLGVVSDFGTAALPAVAPLATGGEVAAQTIGRHIGLTPEQAQTAGNIVQAGAALAPMVPLALQKGAQALRALSPSARLADATAAHVDAAQAVERLRQQWMKQFSPAARQTFENFAAEEAPRLPGGGFANWGLQTAQDIEPATSTGSQLLAQAGAAGQQATAAAKRLTLMQKGKPSGAMAAVGRLLANAAERVAGGAIGHMLGGEGGAVGGLLMGPQVAKMTGLLAGRLADASVGSPAMAQAINLLDRLAPGTPEYQRLLTVVLSQLGPLSASPATSAVGSPQPAAAQ